MADEEIKTYDFSDAVQKKIVAMLLFEHKAFIINREVIRPDYFKSPILAEVVKIITRFFDRYTRVPNQDELLEMMDVHLKDNKKLPWDEYLTVVEEVLKLGVGGDFEFVKDKAVEFAKNQAMEKALQGALPLRKQGKWLQILNNIRDATLVGEVSKDMGVDYFDNLENRLLKRKQGNTRAKTAVKTFLPELDARLGGGLGRQELGIIMSPMKRGKTITAGNFGKGALIDSNNVAYFGGEGNEDKTQLMFDAMISGIKKEEVPDNEDWVREKVNEFFASPLAGKLRIKHYPAGQFSAWTIEAFLQKMRVLEGFEPDLLIVDYLGLMRVADKSGRYEDRYERLSEITKELLSLAQRYNYAIWLLHQSTRASYKKKVVDLDDSADSLEPMRHADAIISLNQTDDERKARPEQFRIFVAGGREMESRTSVIFNIDKSRCQIRQADTYVEMGNEL